MHTNDNQENKFNSLLVEYLNTFNRIELNVGLCLSCLPDVDTQDMNNKLCKMSFDNKIECLLRLTSADYNKKDLHTWCKYAHEKRHERNMYLHGQWEFIHRNEKQISFSIAPWVKDKYEKIYPGRMFTLNKLEDLVSDLRDCSEELGKIVKSIFGIL